MVFLEGGWIDLQYNHACFQIKMEWGIRGLKSKWRRIMKCFDSIKQKYNHLFRIATLLINILHMHRQDFTIENFAEHHSDLTKHGWDGVY